MLLNNIFVNLIYWFWLEIIILILLIFIKKMLRFIMILKYNGYNYCKVITNNI